MRSTTDRPCPTNDVRFARLNGVDELSVRRLGACRAIAVALVLGEAKS